MTKDEALTLALEALEKCDSALAEELAAWDIDPPLKHVLEASNACTPAIIAIKKALAQPSQEPVAWMYPAAQCDRACLYVCTAGFTQFPECASTPPQRPWVGLTDEVQAALWEASRAALPRFHTYATLIEKELRILNT
jgi:hypothetical protein